MNWMRELAMQQYGCIEFVSVTEGDEEISISYWRDLDQIKRWKENPEHVQVQKIGKTRWYRSYRVQITEVLREYHQNSQALLQKTKNEA